MTTAPKFIASKFNPKGKIKEVEGTVLNPVNAGLKFVLTACSESGEYTSDLYKMLVKRFPKVKEDYRSLFINSQLKLGNNQTSPISSEAWIVQLFCLDKNDKLDKKAMVECVKKVLEDAKYEKASLHVSDLLFKEVPALKKLLEADAPEYGVNLYIYKEPEELFKK